MKQKIITTKFLFSLTTQSLQLDKVKTKVKIMWIFEKYSKQNFSYKKGTRLNKNNAGMTEYKR